MRRILAALLFSLWSTLVSAGVPCSLPFNLTNGTTADASQVMANYNAILTCLGQAAAAGTNTDITAIIGLTTPLAPSEGGTPLYVAGTSTGTQNAQVISTLTPSGYTLTPQRFVSFVAGFTNTSALTLVINGTAATNVVAHTATGLASLSGGEVVAGQVTVVYYDGTQYQLAGTAPSGLVQACTEIDYQGVVVPNGYLAEQGQAVSRTTFANLFNCLAYPTVSATTNGTTSVTVPNSALFQIGWSLGGANVTCNSTITAIPDGSHITISIAAGASGATTLSIGPFPQGDCSTTFNVPNLQGRLTAGIDTAGTTLSAVACPNPATLGTRCGSITQKIAVANLPTITSQNASPIAGALNVSAATADSSAAGAGASVSGTTSTSAVTIAANAAVVTSQSTVNTAFLLQPVGLALKAIKY